MSEAAEMAMELEKIQAAIAHARVYVAGHDQADSARNLADRPAYSALRTALEHAEASSERVLRWLREHAGSMGADAPSPWRDGGPL